MSFSFFYSYKNTYLSINGETLLCDNVSLNSSTSLDPNYLQGERNSFSYSAADNIRTSMSIQYYLTGNDPFKRYFWNETEAISGNFCGLTFSSGWLRKYSLDIIPNSPAKALVEVDIFDSLSGSFNFDNSIFQKIRGRIPQTQTPLAITPIPEDITYLTFSDCTLSNYSNEDEGYLHITQGNFTYESEINPYYYAITGGIRSNIQPDAIFFGQKSISFDATCDMASGNLYLTGRPSTLRITLNHPNDSNCNEVFDISGMLHSMDMGWSKDNIFTHKVSVIQNNVGDPPIITSVSSNSVSPGDTLTLYGNEFKNVYSIEIGGKPIRSFKYAALSSSISFVVPSSATSGTLVLNSFNGSFSTGISINYDTGSILNVIPNTGYSGQQIFISGSKFNDIDRVFFNGKSGSFNVIGESLINVIIPSDALYGPITVMSTSRNRSGTWTGNFWPAPSIWSFSPTSGYQGNTITVSGYNFSGLSNVYINNINATFSVTSTGVLTFTVPTGNIAGNIKVLNSGGVSAISSIPFVPTVLITGVTPTSGYINTPIRISGANFYSEYLYQTGSQYGVLIDGVFTGFDRVSNVLLTGYLPSGVTSGSIFILRQDGVSYYPSSYSFYRTPGTPEISDVLPTGLISGQSVKISIGGAELNLINKVWLSGWNSGVASGKSITIYDSAYPGSSPESSSLRVLRTSGSLDLLGSRNNFYYDIVLGSGSLTGNAFLTGVSTGEYLIYASNSNFTGYYSGLIYLQPLPNIGRFDYINTELSSYLTGSSGLAYFSGLYGPNLAFDGITGGSYANGLYCSTETGINPYLSASLNGVAQIHEIRFYPVSDANYFSNSGSFTQYLEIQFLKTGSLLYTGTASISAGTEYISGYGFNTGNYSLRYEADQIKFISHKLSAGTEQSTRFVAAEIEVYGIFN